MCKTTSCLQECKNYVKQLTEIFLSYDHKRTATIFRITVYNVVIIIIIIIIMSRDETHGRFQVVLENSIRVSESAISSSREQVWSAARAYIFFDTTYRFINHNNAVGMAQYCAKFLI